MPAFNYRFEPATISGIPLWGLLYGACAFIFFALFILIPTLFFHTTFFILFSSSLFLSVYFMWLGDEVLFHKDIILSRKYKKCLPCDFDGDK